MTQADGPWTTAGPPRQSNCLAHASPFMRRRMFPKFQWLVCAALAVSATGCPATSAEVRPPPDQLFFPSGLGIAPDESVLFVANANSELRYDSGMIAAIDLDTVDNLIADWLPDRQVPADPDGCPDCCEASIDSPLTLVCNEKAMVLADSSVRLGNFAAAIGVQELTSGDLRLFVPVRGDPSITYIDYSTSDQAMACGGSGSFPLCDEDHRLDHLHNNPDELGLSEEPWGMFVDSGNGYAMVTHLTLGTVSMVDAPPDGAPPLLTDAIGGLFAQNSSTGVRGATGIAGRLPGSVDDLVYVTSRAESRVHTLTVYRRDNGEPTMAPGDYFFLNRIIPSSDSRGIAFSADGNRAYVVNRNPPTLQVVDTSIDTTGVPKNDMIDAIEICREASVIQVADLGDGERAYISCFQDSQVWVLDLERATVLATIPVGRGAHSSALAPGRGRLYVTNFLEDTISVIDIQPGSQTENRVIMQIGRQRQQGGK